ncbi:MAG: glycosyltransferase family 39 protein [Patescibacteria group bacterium]
MAVLAIFAYSYFSFFSLHRYSSPDETANHFFTRQYIETGQFKVAEPLNSPVENIIRPRSFGVNGENLIPASFLGLPLFYGIMGKIFGGWIIYFIGPFFASLSVFFFYLLLRKIFSNRIAFYSALILFLQPVFIFYAMRPFWHNGLFVSLVIFAAYFLLKLIKQGRAYQYFLFGFIFSLALAVRTSEIIWLLATVIIILGLNYKKIKWSKLILCLVGVFVIVVPILYYQGNTFGNSLTTAYTRDILTASSNGSEINILTTIVGKILPFGFQPALFFKTFFDYSFKLMFPWFTLAFFALLIFFKKYFSQRQVNKTFFYYLWFLGLSIWLMVYYGSFVFYEYLDKSLVAYGISYARYWLPLYVFCLPLTVIFLKIISEKIWPNRAKFLFGLLFIILIATSLFQVILDPYYGIKTVKQGFLTQAQEKLNLVLKNTPENAIIIAGQNDKIYWPERKVAGFNGDFVPDQVLRNLPVLYGLAPVYYEEILAGEVSRLNAHLKENGLVFQKISASARLYKLTAIND